MKNYLLATRPKTLLVSFSVCLVSFGVVVHQLKVFDYFLNAVIFLCVLFLQISVNYLNDLLDAQSGKDTFKRLGPSRYVHSGLISPDQMKKASICTLVFAALCGSYLVFVGGFVILILGLCSMALTYFYSAPPLSLASRGLSDIFVLLFFGLIATLGIFYLNYSLIDPPNFSFVESLPELFVAGLQVGFLSLSLAVVNHIRDFQEDSLSGKKTWVVRWGLFFGQVQWLCCIALSYILGSYWILSQNNGLAFFGPMLAIPLYVWVGIRLFTESPSSKHNQYLAFTSLGQCVFSVFLFLSLILRS